MNPAPVVPPVVADAERNDGDVNLAKDVGLGAVLGGDTPACREEEGLGREREREREREMIGITRYFLPWPL